jgi:SOS-response transcriptional repressor LexA
MREKLRRQFVLQEVVSRLGGKAALGRALGHRDGAHIGQMVRGDRPITEKTIEHIESLSGMRGVFTTRAHTISTMPGTKFGAAAAVASAPAKNDALVISLMDVAASMGPGATVPEHERVVSSMEISAAWLRRSASFSAPENLVLLTGDGDSMRGTYDDGDVLLVDRGVTEVRADAVYVLRLGESLYVKRLQRRPDGTVLMISDNKAYDPYLIEGKERQQLRVIGRVVMAWNARRL